MTKNHDRLNPLDLRENHHLKTYIRRQFAAGKNIREIRRDQILRRYHLNAQDICIICSVADPGEFSEKQENLRRRIKERKQIDGPTEAAAKKKVLERDNHQCVVCGTPATCVHHTTPFSVILGHYTDCLESLCDKHHRWKHGEMRKRKALKTHYMKVSRNSQLFSKSRTTGCHLVQETTMEEGHGLD